jgi:hypothetical protein
MVPVVPLAVSALQFLRYRSRFLVSCFCNAFSCLHLQTDCIVTAFGYFFRQSTRDPIIPVAAGLKSGSAIRIVCVRSLVESSG